MSKESPKAAKVADLLVADPSVEAGAKRGRKSKAATYEKADILHWFEQMLRIRRFEERAENIYRNEQKIRGFFHTYIGQEAIAVGVEAATRPSDYVITAYRDHGHGLARGMRSDICMAELFGKVTGCVKGKGGSMHFFSKEHNMLGGHGIVGGQIPLGTGLAFAAKYKGEDNIAICYMGDGAVRQGALHEAFNMAMIWKLPVLYICENNLYAMGTSVERTSNVTDIHKIANGFEMPNKFLEGMDMLTVMEEVQKAADFVRAGNGPMFLEIKTYRYRGHSISDPQKYRTREELQTYKDRDPIAGVAHYALKHAIATQEDFDAIEARIELEIEDAVAFAEASPWPAPSDLYTDVYVGDYPFLME